MELLANRRIKIACDQSQVECAPEFLVFLGSIYEVECLFPQPVNFSHEFLGSHPNFKVHKQIWGNYTYIHIYVGNMVWCYYHCLYIYSSFCLSQFINDPSWEWLKTVGIIPLFLVMGIYINYYAVQSHKTTKCVTKCVTKCCTKVCNAMETGAIWNVASFHPIINIHGSIVL
mgnify:CR=1 FL=1